MTTSSSIADAKNNLTKIIHEAESGSDVCITRHGKAVAMLVSVERYKSKFSEADNGLYGAIMAWRELLNDQDEDLLTDAEIGALRDKESARDFAWD